MVKRSAGRYFALEFSDAACSELARVPQERLVSLMETFEAGQSLLPGDFDSTGNGCPLKATWREHNAGSDGNQQIPLHETLLGRV